MVQAQERSLLDSLAYRAEIQATASGGDYNPLWLNANKYGLSSLKNTNGYLRGVTIVVYNQLILKISIVILGIQFQRLLANGDIKRR